MRFSTKGQCFKLICAAVLSSVVIASTSTAWGADISFPKNQNCVAWKTKKTMFLVKSEEPVGINCSITLTVSSPTAGLKQVLVKVPIDKFDSGEVDRDKEVLLLLKADRQKDLEFLSKEITEAQWPDYLAGKMSVLQGALRIAGESYPVDVQLKKSEDTAQDMLSGSLETTFTAFKIEPPSVAGGVVAKVKDTLTLVFQLNPASLQ